MKAAHTQFAEITPRDDDEPEHEMSSNVDREMWCQGLVLYPYSARRFFWDFSTLLLVSYEAVGIPLEFLEPPPHPFIDFMRWVTRLFWTMDIIVTLFTGHVMHDGTIEMRPMQIWRNYCKNRLWFDLTCVAPDWIELFWTSLTNTGGVTRFQRAARAFRILRCLRLMRVFRVKKVLHFFIEQVQSDAVVLAVDITKALFVLAIFAHLVGCFWYAVGSISSAPGWPEVTGYQDLPLGHRYLISIHWGISQFGGSFSEVTPAPENETERTYAVCVYLFGLVVVSAFIGYLTTYMTNFCIQESGDTRRVAMLRRYLRQAKVSKPLLLRLQRSATSALRQRRLRIAEEDVELLRYVSVPLQVELHYEMYVSVLTEFPFFVRIAIDCPQLMRKVCHTAVSMSFVHCGDIVFSDGAVAMKMYIVVRGRSMYTTRMGDTFETSLGQCISEAALWTSWEHQGELVALSDGKVCEVDVKCFHDIVAAFRSADGGLKEYAADFCEKLNNMDEDITDLLTGHDRIKFKSRAARITMIASQSLSRSSFSKVSPSRGSVISGQSRGLSRT